MGTTLMRFTREDYNYKTYVTQKEGDKIEFETTQAPEFPDNTKATKVAFYIAKGLKSGSGEAKGCDIRVDFKCNGSWCGVWYGEQYLSGDGGDGTVPEFTIDIPYGHQRNFAAYGVDEVRIVQDGSKSIKGMSTANGTATFTYEDYPIRCTAPRKVTVEKSVTSAEENRLSWSGASAGQLNAISGYYIQYADSTDNENWSEWAELKSVGVVSSTNVAMPAEKTYRKYKVWTLGAAGSDFRSADGTESAATFRGHAELEGFTDSPLVVGETHVKALHMQELQDRVNTLRDFYRLSAYKFTQITAGATDLKDWTAHVNEIRAAVDEISNDHEAWLDIPINCPRADVIEQLRAVILAM